MSASVVPPSVVQDKTALRTADWRFLLPSPPEGTFRHLVLLGSPAAHAEAVLEAGLARQVSSELPASRVADAVVVRTGVRVDPGAIAAALVPGGSLYYEIDRKRLPAGASLRDFRKLLHNAGLLQTGLYWVEPSFARCIALVSLDVPEVVAWYGATHMRKLPTFVRKVLRKGWRPASAVIGRLLARRARHVALTAVAAPGPSAIPLLQGFGLPEHLQPAAGRVVMLRLGNEAEDRARLVLLPFAPGAREPHLAAKLTRLPGGAGKIEAEQNVLASLHDCLDDRLRRTVPRPLGVFRDGSATVGVESFAPGFSQFPETTVADDAGLDFSGLPEVVEWLTDLHRQTRHSGEWGRDEIEEWVERPLARYRRLVGTTAAEDRLFSEVHTRAEALIGQVLPRVWMHGDLAPKNVHSSRSGIAVVDWVTGRVGLPLIDLLFYASCWSYQAPGFRSVEAHARLFSALYSRGSEDDRVTAAVRAAVQGYVERLGIHEDWLPVLVVLFLVHYAVVWANSWADPNLYADMLRHVADSGLPPITTREVR
jgi:aminoglycoside phosphotransferase (APT) family kinase protein